jgi:hypothetical protein
MKVYCKNCKWSKVKYFDEICDKIYCRHENNLKTVNVGSYLDEWTYQKPIKCLSEINKNNNCTWYKRKWWKVGV